jgi:DNA-directed RNA polymerase subunit RPC12/RpoP
MQEKDEEKICVICSKPFTGYGNNAQPVKEGECCDYCNISIVLVERIRAMKRRK